MRLPFEYVGGEESAEYSRPFHEMVHNCPECETRTMIRHVADGKVVFRCPCGHSLEGRGRDRLIHTGGTAAVSQEEVYSTLLSNVAKSRTGLRVFRECSDCGLPYMTQVRLGKEETIILVCKCGKNVKVS